MNLEISEIPRISITNRIKTGEKNLKLDEIEQKNTVLRRYLLSRKARNFK